MFSLFPSNSFIGGIPFFPSVIIFVSAASSNLDAVKSFAPEAPNFPSSPWQAAQCIMNKFSPTTSGVSGGSDLTLPLDEEQLTSKSKQEQK